MKQFLSLPGNLLWLLYNLGQSVFVTGIRLIQNQVLPGELKKCFKRFFFFFVFFFCCCFFFVLFFWSAGFSEG